MDGWVDGWMDGRLLKIAPGDGGAEAIEGRLE